MCRHLRAGRPAVREPDCVGGAVLCGHAAAAAHDDSRGEKGARAHCDSSPRHLDLQRHHHRCRPFLHGVIYQAQLTYVYLCCVCATSLVARECGKLISVTCWLEAEGSVHKCSSRTSTCHVSALRAYNSVWLPEQCPLLEVFKLSACNAAHVLGMDCPSEAVPWT